MAQADKNTDLIENFIDKVKWLHEPDYGDFKRKVGLYLKRLEQEMGEKAQQVPLRIQFHNLMNEVVYSPNGEVESTRDKTIQWARQLKSQI